MRFKRIEVTDQNGHKTEFLKDIDTGKLYKRTGLVPRDFPGCQIVEETAPSGCEDCISREWLKTAIHNFYQGLVHIPTEEDIQAYIDAAPSITPQPKTDKWSIKEVADTLEKHGLIREQVSCEDCISRQALYEWLDGWKEKNKYYHPHTKNEIIPTCEVIDIIQSLPSVTPKPKIGHWKRVELGLFDSVSIRWECSECKKSDRFRSNFCFNCGAKMESEVEE